MSGIGAMVILRGQRAGDRLSSLMGADANSLVVVIEAWVLGIKKPAYETRAFEIYWVV
jgi:hypothetical protein